MEKENGYSVLVVDDEEGIRSMIGELLRLEGYKCMTAANGKEAFESICNNKIDAVISDILMPESSGIDLLEKVKDRNLAVPHLALISGFTETPIPELYDKGAEAFLPKPFRMDELVKTLKHILTPVEEWWPETEMMSEEDCYTITQEFDSFEKAIQEEKFLLGRGGMFMKDSLMDVPLEVGNKVKFDFKFKNSEIKSFKGGAIVRWMRKKEHKNLAAGIGMEFEYIEEEYRKKILSFIHKSTVKAYIPKG